MIKVLHNNTCSKSRAILEHLDENNVPFEIIDFMETPLTELELKTLLKKAQHRYTGTYQKKRQDLSGTLYWEKLQRRRMDKNPG